MLPSNAPSMAPFAVGWRVGHEDGKASGGVRKDLLGTGALCAKKAAYMHDEVNRAPTGWKIMQHPCVPALDPRRLGSTRRA